MASNSNAKIGAGFEDYTKSSLAIQGWDVERIPNGCRVLFGGKKIIPIKSPFDFFASRENKALFFDAKTIQGEAYPYSAINQDQVEKLHKIQKNGFVAGYIIHFRQVNKYCFIDAKTLSEIMPRASIKARECVDIGKEIKIDKVFATSEA